MRKKQFKVLLNPRTNRYQVWITNHNDEWIISSVFSTFDFDGNSIEGKCHDVGLVSENILWEINHLAELGYRFIGVKRIDPVGEEIEI